MHILIITRQRLVKHVPTARNGRCIVDAQFYMEYISRQMTSVGLFRQQLRKNFPAAIFNVILFGICTRTV
jgi:hypothetical protein